MSKEAVEAVMGKAMLDATFRGLLFAKPNEALAGFDLTDTERAALKAIDKETFDTLSNTLDARTSKSALGNLVHRLH